ncbi:MAG: transposase [Candidatus Accumulibacter sp.]|nr:transposase [Accumulibacter sp.]
MKSYDYSRAGAYFITVCTQDRACSLGEIVNGEMRLNDMGEIVVSVWRAISKHFPNVTTDEFIVMPNHIHGIVVIADASVGATHASPLHASPLHASPLHALRGRTSGPSRGSIGAIIGSFKSAVAKRVNESRGVMGVSVWQRNYYENVIRNDDALNHARQYIIDNPAQWAMDRENPEVNKHGAIGADVGARHASPLRDAVVCDKLEALGHGG